MKRKLKTKYTAARLDREDARVLESLSLKHKLPQAEIIRMAIRRFAEMEPKEAQAPNAAD